MRVGDKWVLIGIVFDYNNRLVMVSSGLQSMVERCIKFE